MGGRSEEREVSLSTGRMIMAAIDRDKYNAFAVDSGRFGMLPPVGSKDIVESTDDTIEDGAVDLFPMECLTRNGSSVDVAFIALHGRFGEDGTVQGMLELLGIPYVGSGVLASALAMDKIMARKVFERDGIPLPKAVVLGAQASNSGSAQEIERELGLPVVVKPNHQGSSIGLSIAGTHEELVDALNLAFQYDDELLIEQFIKGVEISCPVLGNRKLQALPVIEIVPAGGIYDYHAKYTPGATQEIVPARIPEKQYKQAQELAVACHNSLGCKGMSRTDMIVRGEELFVLETNTIPGMTPTSLLPRAAQAAGIEFPELLDRLIGYALEER